MVGLWQELMLFLHYLEQADLQTLVINKTMICYQKVIQEVRNKYKDILFVPCEAGLGNRLYALYAGYYLSHLFNLQDKTIILWPTCSYYCDTVFHDLF